MAEKLTALSDLIHKFAKYPELADLFKEIQAKTTEINEFNKNSAGHDELGKTYHENVDEPTTTITELFAKVQHTVDTAGKGGKNTSQIMNDADHEAGG
ncbi:hypothetical protein ATKI12_6788 [Kitasatospora sp. Ki12]|uniref:hypothetical protein n=1 Tax=Kitasatospora xanthocidica TaxID=83382 RepID=UPI0016771CCA|nr:hypothetical protein [Kitasatospora xanthocidica]GHF63753.1 hypothetical protein GCM10018790_47080 [Kitasatospora xanthocidica]